MTESGPSATNDIVFMSCCRFVMPLIPDDLAMECGNKPTTRPPDVMKQQSLEVIGMVEGCVSRAFVVSMCHPDPTCLHRV